MFGAPETSKVDDDQAHLAAAPVPRAAIDMSMLDDFDDAEGYYKVVIGVSDPVLKSTLFLANFLSRNSWTIGTPSR